MIILLGVNDYRIIDLFHVERAKLVYLFNKGPVAGAIEDLFGIQWGSLAGMGRKCLLLGKCLTATVAVFYVHLSWEEGGQYGAVRGIVA